MIKYEKRVHIYISNSRWTQLMKVQSNRVTCLQYPVPDSFRKPSVNEILSDYRDVLVDIEFILSI